MSRPVLATLEREPLGARRETRRVAVQRRAIGRGLRLSGATAIVALAVVAAPAASVLGQGGLPPVDEEYTAKILEFTTAPEFLTPLVEFLPASETVPSPLDHHGYIAGAADHLTYAATVHDYMKALDAASDRIEVRTMGLTEEGRERILVLASSAQNLRNLDRYREITARLADPRGLTDDEAEALIAEGKPFYWAVGGLHSGETGPPEMLMELAYRLAVEERPLFRDIRDDSIVVITPVMEVDGRERVVDVMRYRQEYPDRPSPPLLYWGKYVAHDNNRDGIGMALSLSRQSVATFLEYHPQVMHDLHESIPFLYIMAGHGPYNPWLDPIVTEEWTEMAWHEVRQMNAWNVPGVWTFDFFDGWATNYMIYAALGRNAIGRFYETFGNSSPETRVRDIGGQARRDWFRMNPPYEKVLWSLRNNTNLMQSALLTGMHNVARNRERFLGNFLLKGRRSVQKAHVEGPAAWLVPADQERPVLATAMINLLRSHGIEVHRADESFSVAAERRPEAGYDDTEFAAGTYVLRMDQPYSRLADMLLDYQYYNPTDPSPYDDTGWSLGPLFNVETYRVKDVSVLDVAMEELGSDVKPAGGVRGAAGAAYLVAATGEPWLATLRYKLADVPVRAAETSFEAGDVEYPAGTFVIAADAAPDLRQRLDEAGRELGIEIGVAGSMPEVATHAVSAPRLALMHNWSRTQSEGWYRVALDELEIPYDYISIHEARDIADLRARWDVILIGPGIGGFTDLVNDDPAPYPVPYQTTELTPNLGKIASTPDTRRGLGYEGIVNLRTFVREGGLIAAMTSSSSLMIDSGITPFVAQDSTPGDLQARGAIFNATVSDASSPIAYGYGEELGVYFSNGPLLRVAVGFGGFGGFGGRGGGRGNPPSGRRGEDFVPGRPPTPEGMARAEEEEAAEAEAEAEEAEEADDEPWTNVDNLLRETDPRLLASRPPAGTFPRIVVRFAERPSELLLSGMLNNGRSLAARPAVIDAPVGAGHVVFFALNPMWRRQTWGQYGLLLNAVLHWDALDVGQPTPEKLTEAGQAR